MRFAGALVVLPNLTVCWPLDAFAEMRGLPS